MVRQVLVDLRGLVTDPNSVMDRKVGSRLLYESILLLLIGLAAAVGHAYVAWEVWSQVELDVLQMPLIGYIFEPILTIFIIWIFYAAGVHYISNFVFNSRTPIVRMMKLTAWALIPYGIARLLRSGVLYWAVQDVDVEQALEDVPAVGFTGVLEAALDPVRTEPVYILSPILLILGVLATGYLLLYAATNAKDISREDALKAVGIVVGIHLLYLLRETWFLINDIGFI